MSNTSVMLTKEQKAIIAEALDVMPEDLEEIKVKASACKKTSFRDDFSMVFKDNTVLKLNGDCTLSTTDHTLTLICDRDLAVWKEVARSLN